MVQHQKKLFSQNFFIGDVKRDYWSFDLLVSIDFWKISGVPSQAEILLLALEIKSSNNVGMINPDETFYVNLLSIKNRFLRTVDSVN